jgi:putative hydrolase of the HAD superfamily
MQRTLCAVFDIDDTLYLERDYVQSGFRAVGAWAARWTGISDFAERCWSCFLAGERQSVFNHALVEAGKECTPGLVSAMVEIYRAHVPSIALTNDAVAALKEISRTASVAIVSDGPAASQSRKADALGLELFAEPIILTEVLGPEFRKPNPAAFQRIEQTRPASVFLYVADNPAKDFAGPQQLGWTTVRVRRPGGLHYASDNISTIPDYEMPDCTELPHLISHLCKPQ